MDWYAIITGVAGGLCIFLLGMKRMSEGMQAIAGNRLRKMIGAVTDNRLLACGTGTLVTATIQSSSVTTVMLVGFVNAGLMTLTQSIGVILGADIGTTITGWIVSLKVAKYGLPVLAVSGFFYLFTKNERLRHISITIMGIGMIFYGLALMKGGLKPLSKDPGFIEWFGKFEPSGFFGLFKCILVGAVATAIVQSSSATVAITMTLAGSGAISFEAAVALVLGQNIGTTITAFLASIGASTAAKRVAYAHTLIKVIGVLLLFFLFFLYLDLLRSILPDDMPVERKIASSHTIFNVLLVIAFLPLRDLLAAVLLKLAPDKPHKEAPHLTFLDIRMLDTPAFGLQQSADEILKMRDGVAKMMGWLRHSISGGQRDEEGEKHLFHREEVLDVMQKEIVEFLSKLLSGSVSQDVMKDARKQLRISDEYESISDYLTAIMKLDLKLRSAGLDVSEQGRQDIVALHDRIAEYLKMIGEAVEADNGDILSKATSQGHTITHNVKEIRAEHIERVERQEVSPLKSMAYVDMLNSYRKVKDHALNIAEALAGEK